MSTTTINESGEPLNKPIDKERRATIAVAAVVGGAGVVAAAVPFVTSFMPSERAKAAGAPVEADISGMAPGEMRSFEWQGRPVWILNRTPQMLQSIRKADSEVADPKSLRTTYPTPAYARNEYRSIKPEYFVAIGICTHLGCNPIGPFAAGRQLDARALTWLRAARVMARRSTSPAVCTRTSRRRTTSRCRRINILSANVVLIGDDSKS